MADIVTRLAKRLAPRDAAPRPLPRFEVADLLARVNAELARRAA